LEMPAFKGSRGLRLRRDASRISGFCHTATTSIHRYWAVGCLQGSCPTTCSVVAILSAQRILPCSRE